MTYELRDITAADQQKILQDFEKYDKGVFEHCHMMREFDPSFFSAKTWAVNDKENSYLLYATLGRIVAPEDLLKGSSYCFLYKNIIYKLQFEEDISDTLEFIDASFSDIAPDVLEAIKDAFTVYGRFGDGDEDESESVEADFI